MEIYQTSLYYEFGPYRLDPNRRVLTKAGETISLTPKATDILLTLIQNAGQLVEKDELLRVVWPDTFVEESNLTQNIFTLRRALGDERGGPKYIETVTRRGYRFAAPVRIIRSNENQVITTESAELSARGLVIAVMPFLNATGNHELEYLADGLTDNLINSLSRVPKLRVISRSAVFRYKTVDGDPHQVATGLGANVVLLGKINSQPNGIAISVELVDVTTNWQLWGDSFDADAKDILEIPERISRQVLATFNLSAADNEGTCVASRYTENSKAYDAYLEGRYHWSQYTRTGIETAIGHFRRAIELDPNYALAYAGIVDCYLRLATNYLPPEDALHDFQPFHESDARVKLRFEWDWKSVERELRRAEELKTDYLSMHQWYAACQRIERIYDRSYFSTRQNQFNNPIHNWSSLEALSGLVPSLELTLSEQVQVYCAIVREQIDIGNYEAACRVLEPWWSFGNWPKLDGLNQRSCADLLLTAGELAGCVASTKQLRWGQKHGEELLNGSIALFEQLGFRTHAAEGRIELALCYYRQGLFDIGRSTLIKVCSDLSDRNWELRSLTLIRLASLERHSGRLKDALAILMDATSIVKLSGPWATGRYHLELASTYKDLAIAEGIELYFEDAQRFYSKALYELEAVGHYRYVAVVENNVGLLLLSLGAHQESERHLLRSRKLFNGFSDHVRGAQVEETLARLYIETQRYAQAHEVIERAVTVLELTDGEALLAEALITNGVVRSRLQEFANSKRSFEAAYKVAERCGDSEGAGRALLVMVEELGKHLEITERVQVTEKLKSLFATTQQSALQLRVEASLAKILSPKCPE